MERSPTSKGATALSIVIPAYNEATRIVDSLQRILEYAEKRFECFEIVVVDDCSSDETIKVVEAFSHASIRCLRNAANFGKGYSVRRGMLEARYDLVVFSDADLSAPIEEIEKLIEAWRDGADVAIGSRRLSRAQDVRRSLWRRFLGWGFSVLVGVLVVRGFRDTQCGFKLFTRAASRVIFPYQRIDRWGFDAELLCIARKRRLEIREVPVRWYQSGGTRLKWWTPLLMAFELVRIRWYSVLGRYRRDPSKEKAVKI